MSYVAIREFTPMIGKDAVLEDRILRTSDVIEKYGAVSRVGKVIEVTGLVITSFIIGMKPWQPEPVQWTVTQMILT